MYQDKPYCFPYPRRVLLTLPHSNRVVHDDGYWKAVWQFQYFQNGEPQHAVISYFPNSIATFAS